MVYISIWYNWDYMGIRARYGIKYLGFRRTNRFGLIGTSGLDKV